MDTCKALAQCYAALLSRPDAWKATKYLSPKETVVVTRRRFRGRVRKEGDYIVSVGRPNYESRLFIKKCKATKEPFPVKRVQIKALPKRRR